MATKKTNQAREKTMAFTMCKDESAFRKMQEKVKAAKKK